MKHTLALAMLLLPLLAAGQTPKPTEAQSKQRLAKLVPLLQQYDARYDYFCRVPDCDFVIITKDYRQGIVDLDGKVLLPFEYFIFRQNGTSLFLVMNEDKLGLVDKHMRWVVPMEYDNPIECLECLDMGAFFSGGYAVLHKNGKYGAVDTTGKVIVPFKYDLPFSINKELGMLKFYDDSNQEHPKEYMTDFNGNLLIGPYEQLEGFHEGLAAFSQNGKTGFIDTKGKVVLPCKYDYAWDFEEGYCIVGLNNRPVLIDRKGNVKYTFGPSEFCEGTAWKGSVLIVRHEEDDWNYQYGAIDHTGKELAPRRYKWWCMLNDTYLAMLNEDESCDIYDRQGRMLKHFQQFRGIIFDPVEVSDFYGEYFAVMQDSLWGIVDRNLQTVLPCRYKEASHIGNGCCRVVGADGRPSFIDLKGKPLITGPYEELFPEADGLFKFYTGNPDDYEEIIVGYVDLYGNTTATRAQLEKMNKWMKKK